MKRKYLSLVVLFLIQLVNAQNTVLESISELENITQATVSINKNLKIPGFIKFPINKPYILKGNSLKEKVTNFLNINKSIYAIENIS